MHLLKNQPAHLAFDRYRDHKRRGNQNRKGTTRSGSIVLLAMICLILASTGLTACFQSAPTSILEPDECQDVVISERAIELLPGDSRGVRTASFNVYLPKHQTSQTRQYFDVTLFVEGEPLEPQGIPAISRASFVELAILLDMDPKLLSEAPSEISRDGNKKYYFRDAISSVLETLALSDGTQNTALIAKPSGGTERLISDSEAYNTLLLVLPELATMEKQVVERQVQQQWENWLDYQGDKPRLTLVLRLQDQPLDSSGSSYADDGPTVVVDIGQPGSVSSEDQLTVVPLGASPRRFDQPDWPASDTWQDQLDEMHARASEAIPGAVVGVSHMYQIPELYWETLIKNHEAQSLMIRVTTTSGPVVASCARPAIVPEAPRVNSDLYLLLIAVSIFGTAAASLFFYLKH